LVTKNTLIYIVNKFPDLASQYADFLSTLNISFDDTVSDLGWNIMAAEKFIVSVKLKKYLESLENERKEKINAMINGENYTNVDINEINKKIDDVNERLEKLLYKD